ncbi:MAG: hypothetical protein ACLUE2_14600 [Bacteroides cellulosilyticus]
MKKYLNHILALIIALSGLSSCSDKDEPSPSTRRAGGERILSDDVYIGRRHGA